MQPKILIVRPGPARMVVSVSLSHDTGSSSCLFVVRDSVIENHQVEFISQFECGCSSTRK